MASAFKLRNLIKKENVKQMLWPFYLPHSLFLDEFMCSCYPKFPSSSPPRVHLLYTKAYLPSSDASLKSHLFCSRALERDQIAKACESQRK